MSEDSKRWAIWPDLGPGKQASGPHAGGRVSGWDFIHALEGTGHWHLLRSFPRGQARGLGLTETEQRPEVSLLFRGTRAFPPGS